MAETETVGLVSVGGLAGVGIDEEIATGCHVVRRLRDEVGESSATDQR